MKLKLSILLLLLTLPLRAEDLADKLRALDTRVLPEQCPWGKPSEMLAKDARSRIDAVNKRETENWRKLQSKEDWEKYRDQRVDALKKSLGVFPTPPNELKVRVTGKIEGQGFRIEKIVFETRPGLWVTANRYLPEKPTDSMPGIVICHSHHNPKTQSELQDMGIGWAKQGCVVVVPDMLGHGERRQHPFTDASKYAGSFRPGRQDYYFRYNVGMQLHLIGESLIGWMVWDLMRCVDVLVQQPGIDPKRIAMFGSVAGGGDPVAVAGAIDTRIQVVAPFNFGGPQPETTFPLPENPEDRFNYAGGGSWESTRNLRLSCRDGFLPWVIVGAIAPRKLIYGHEFSWDRENDPVWARLQKIYGWYGAPENLAGAHGRGKLSGKPPEATHCNNIGPEHRQSMAPALKKWLAIDAPEVDARLRRSAEDLQCRALKPGEYPTKIEPQHTARFVMEGAIARRSLEKKPDDLCMQIRESWAKLLGDIEPTRVPKAVSIRAKTDGWKTEAQVVLEVEHGIHLPLFLLVPPLQVQWKKVPLVLAFAQEGKTEFLKNRSQEIAELYKSGVAICLVDLRGTGETRPGNDRGRSSWATSISSMELMLGRTAVGLKLKDLRTVLNYLRSSSKRIREDLDPRNIALWGDSFAEPNSADSNIIVPFDAEKLPRQSEPLGSILALLGALFDDDIRAVYGHGGIGSFRDALGIAFGYYPHDIIVPGLLKAGDLDEVAQALAPRPIRLAGQVNGLNQRIGPADPDKSTASQWLLQQLREKHP